MSAKESSGKEKRSGQKARKVHPPAKEQATWNLEAETVAAWQRSQERPELLDPAAVLSLQNSLGNEAVQRLLNTPAGVVQLTPTAPTPSGLASTTGRQASAIPAAVRREYQVLVDANNLLGALNRIVRHMTDTGELDPDLLRTQANPSGRTICRGADCFILIDGGGAFTNPCAEIVEGATKLPNPRIQVGRDIIRNPVRLHATLLHEYRHVQQRFALINQSGTGPTGASHCLDCNSPTEMDAYLAEIERGYDPLTMVQGFARVHVIWGYLAPEQQAVFQSRKTAAEAKIARHYPRIPWGSNGEVIAYRRGSEALIAAHERRTGHARPFYCNSVMAPLNPTTPVQGPASSGSGSGAPAVTSEPSGAGSGTPTVTPEAAGAGSGSPTVTPEAAGAGSGTPTVTPEAAGAGSGTPTVTSGTDAPAVPTEEPAAAS